MMKQIRTLILLVATLQACGKPESPVSSEVIEARRLLAEAGFPGGKGFPKLTLVYNTAETHQVIATAIQEMWRKNLGIEIRLENMEWRVFMDRVASGDFEIARRAWVGEYMDPHAFLALFAKGSGNNPTGWSSAEYDRLLEESNAETDPLKRKKLLDAAERILVEEGAVMPIYNYVAYNYLKPFVKGVRHNARDMHPIQDVWLEGEGAPEDGMLVFNAGEEPGSIDPALSHDIAGLKILMHLFEGLVSYDPGTAEPVPGAAERWDVSEDGKTYTFHLRPVVWSNGEPLTARDFVYSWRRVVDPKTASLYAHRMYLVKNAREITKGAKPPETLGVRAVDDRTLAVELVHAAPYFPQLACLNIFYPVHRAAVEKHGRDWTRPGNIVHNGPYRIVKWDFNDKKIFEKNPKYWNADQIKLERFKFVSIPDEFRAFTMYEAGEVHWLFKAPLQYIEKLSERGDLMIGPYNAVYFYVFNVRRKPLDDVRVRKALSLAVEREKIASSILRGGETPADRFVPPTSRLGDDR